MKKPSDREIEEAKEYIRQRLEAETSMNNNLKKAFQEAARKIISISYRYNIPPHSFRFSANRNLQKEVDEVISALREIVEDYTYTLSVATHKDKEKDILIYINRESYGKTFPERNAIYCRRYKYELEAAVASFLLAGISQSKALQSITDYLKHPYDNPFITDAIDKGNMSATRLQTDGICYGVGRTNSSFTALAGLTTFAVAEGWMRYWYLSGRDNGAIGFITFRASSYPCEICNDYTHKVHPMTDQYPPLHNHCVCGMAFIY